MYEKLVKLGSLDQSTSVRAFMQRPRPSRARLTVNKFIAKGARYDNTAGVVVHATAHVCNFVLTCIISQGTQIL